MKDAIDILNFLISSNADEWNIWMADELNIEVCVLKDIIKLREQGAIEKLSEISIKKDLMFSKMNTKEVLATLRDKVAIRYTEKGITVDGLMLTGKVIVGFDFSEANLSDSYFCGCVFDRCKFTSSMFQNAVFVSSTFTECEMNFVDFSKSNFGRSKLVDCDLSETIFDYTTICDSAFLGCDMSQSTWLLSKVLFSGFSECNFSSSAMKDISLVQCSMLGCEAERADFRRASITDCLLTRTTFGGCEFQSSVITGCTTVMCEIDEQYLSAFDISMAFHSPAIWEWEEKEIDEDFDDE